MYFFFCLPGSSLPTAPESQGSNPRPLGGETDLQIHERLALKLSMATLFLTIVWRNSLKWPSYYSLALDRVLERKIPTLKIEKNKQKTTYYSRNKNIQEKFTQLDEVSTSCSPTCKSMVYSIELSTPFVRWLRYIRISSVQLGIRT